MKSPKRRNTLRLFFYARKILPETQSIVSLRHNFLKNPFNSYISSRKWCLPFKNRDC